MPALPPALRRWLRPVARPLRFALRYRRDHRLSQQLPPVATVGRDVVVVRTDAIGDFLLWRGAAEQIARHYRSQNRRVVAVVNRLCAGLARDLGCFDDVWELDKEQFLHDDAYRLAFLSRLRRHGFAIALHPTLSREVWFGDSLLRWSGAPERIGSAGDCSNQLFWERWISNRWYSRLLSAAVDPHQRGYQIHELERHAEVLHGLEITSDPPASLLLPLPLPDLTEAPPRPYAILFPGASWVGRQWPLDRFAALAERLHQRTGWAIVVAGGPDDRPLAQAIQHHANVSVLDWTGKTSLGGLATLLARSQMVICNETSAVHMATLAQVPTVCLVGGGHYGRFTPYPLGETSAHLTRCVAHLLPCFGCNWDCHRPHSPSGPVACIAALSVDQLWAEVEPLLPPAGDA